MKRLKALAHLKVAGVALVAAMLVSACASGGGSSTPSATGNTVTFAEAAGGAPNYIMPLASGS